MTDFTLLVGKQINLIISGKELINGILIDVGKDILVLYNGRQYMYIPLFHVQQIELNQNKEEYVELPSEITVSVEIESPSIQNILTNAKEMFTELYLTRRLSFHGYISDILEDYIIFYSPLYKSIYIPINHLKWLIPHNEYTTTFALKSLSNSNPALLSFQDQLKMNEGNFVIFDGGVDLRKKGLLNKVQNNFAELTLITGEKVFVNLSHIKSWQLP